MPERGVLKDIFKTVKMTNAYLLWTTIEFVHKIEELKSYHTHLSSFSSFSSWAVIFSVVVML